MRRPSHDDVEAAQRLSEPLLARRAAGGSGGGGPGSSSDVEQGGAAGPPSRGLSPDARPLDLYPAATPGGAFRLTKRTSTAQVVVTVQLAVGLHVMQAAGEWRQQGLQLRSMAVAHIRKALAWLAGKLRRESHRSPRLSHLAICPAARGSRGSAGRWG